MNKTEIDGFKTKVSTTLSKVWRPERDPAGPSTLPQFGEIPSQKAKNIMRNLT